ncbi:MAG: hypothetical protein ACXADL_07335 [Candidatus Thorarchaeota archaeon]|jgi:hypothetical protein
MGALETKIRSGLENKGIKCQTVYKMANLDEKRVLLAFNSQKNPKLSTRKIERVLNDLGIGEVKVPKEFSRLSSAFLHLEVVFGARTEKAHVLSAH